MPKVRIQFYIHTVCTVCTTDLHLFPYRSDTSLSRSPLSFFFFSFLLPLSPNLMYVCIALALRPKREGLDSMERD